MKKILLLPLIFSAVCTHAQQPDSLLNELRHHSLIDTTRINLLIKISKSFLKTDTAKTFQYADSAILLATQLNNTLKLADSYNNKAINYALIENLKPAIPYKNLYLKQLLILNNKIAIAECYNYLSWLYSATGEYVTGITFGQKGLIASTEIPDSALIARSLNVLGINYGYMANYPKAIKYTLDALNLYSNLDDKTMTARMYGNIGVIYYYMKQYDEAIIYTDKSLKILENLKDTIWIAATINNLGGIYLDTKDYQKSIKYNQRALLLNKAIKSKKGTGNDLMDLGAAYNKLKDYAKAFYYLDEAIKMYEEIGAKNNIAIALGHLSDVCINAPAEILIKMKIDPVERFAKAISYQTTAINLAQETKDLMNEAEQWKNLSAIYKKKHDPINALNAYEKFFLLHDSVINNKNQKEVFTSTMQYDYERQRDSIKNITDKQQAFAAAEINKQKIIRNASIGSGTVLVLAAIAGVFFYRRKKEAETQKNEAELKAEITDTEMKALRAQMNPHFIFNSLNSIADYIDKNQTQTASDFTAKFAKLMRMVLENSEHKEIPLADDLKALELYMQMERFRLQHKFDYEIKVDEGIDQENTLVPPLILQPFVENSIWHGIAGKEGRGNITIHIKQQDGMLNCIVEDDGVGISATKIVDKENKSLGMRITKERIDVINKMKNANASINVFNKNKGVRAEVKLPLELSF